MANYPYNINDQSTIRDWVENIKLMLGNSFTQDDVSVVGAETFALAYVLDRIAGDLQTFVNESNPLTAVETIDDWAIRYGVDPRNKSIDDLRAEILLKYQAQIGALEPVINANLSQLFGSQFVGIELYKGVNLDSPPNPTISNIPGGNNLGGGGQQWYTIRDHILVKFEYDTYAEAEEIYNKWNVAVFPYMNSLVPVYATFDRTIDNSAYGYQGFVIDGSTPEPDAGLIGFTAL